MSNEQQKPLTAEELVDNFVSIKYGGYNGLRPSLYRADAIGLLSDYAAQQTAALREELEECKTRNNELEAENKKAYDRHELMTNIADGLRQSLGAKKASMACLQEDKRALMESYDLREKELESVKKERDEWKSRFHSVNEKAAKDAGLMANALMQRDEAVKLLKQIQWLKPCLMYPDEVSEDHRQEAEAVNNILIVIDNCLSRLSSGEKKPVSPWISVEDSLPEPYTEVYAGSFDEDGYFGQTVCWHSGEHWEGIEITADSMITHWATKLAPPESLNDKTE